MKRYIIPLVVVVFLGGVAAVILLLTGPRMKNQPNLKAFEFEAKLPPDDTVPLDNEYVAVLTDYALPENNGENLRRGKTYYTYYCVFCHGKDGRGNGPVGKSYIPKPADLTRSMIRTYEADKLYNAVFTGTGHSPALERIVPPEHRSYLMLYAKYGF